MNGSSASNKPRLEGQARAPDWRVWALLAGVFGLGFVLTRRDTATSPASSPMPKRPWSLQYGLMWAMYGIVVVGAASWMYSKASSRPDPLRAAIDLPAYHVIRPDDLAPTPVPTTQPTPGGPTATPGLVGSISLVPLKGGQTITSDQLLRINDPAAVAASTVIAIEGGADLVFGSGLQPGVTVAAWRGADEEAITKQAIILAVKPQEATVTPESRARFVLILAVPPEARAPIVAAARARTLSLSVAP